MLCCADGSAWQKICWWCRSTVHACLCIATSTLSGRASSCLVHATWRACIYKLHHLGLILMQGKAAECEGGQHDPDNRQCGDPEHQADYGSAAWQGTTHSCSTFAQLPRIHPALPGKHASGLIQAPAPLDHSAAQLLSNLEILRLLASLLVWTSQLIIEMMKFDHLLFHRCMTAPSSCATAT